MTHPREEFDVWLEKAIDESVREWMDAGDMNSSAYWNGYVDALRRVKQELSDD